MRFCRGEAKYQDLLNYLREDAARMGEQDRSSPASRQSSQGQASGRHRH